MTPDQRFARWVQIAIAALVCAFTYFLFADLAAPLTPQAQLNRPVVRIAPRVSGQVVEVAVANNQHVEPGDLLFRLDPEPFRLPVRQAELAVEQAIQGQRRAGRQPASRRGIGGRRPRQPRRTQRAEPPSRNAAGQALRAAPAVRAGGSQSPYGRCRAAGGAGEGHRDRGTARPSGW